MKPKTWRASANLAIEGIIYSVKTQRHMRFHLYAALAALILGLFLTISRLEFIILCLTILLVLVAEMVNTAIEVAVDLVVKEYHPVAKTAKDVAAGVVLLASVGALTVAYLVLYPALKTTIGRGIWHVKKAPADVVTLVSLAVVIIVVIILKALFGRGEPLRGGMPSGHAAVSFSIWVAVMHLTASAPIILAVLAAALAVSWSRWSAGIHRTREVIAGAALGVGITALLFRLFT